MLIECMQLLCSRLRSKTYVALQLRSEEDYDPNGPCQQYTDAQEVLRDLQTNLQADKTLLMQVLASIWRKVRACIVESSSICCMPDLSWDSLLPAGSFLMQFAVCKKLPRAVCCLQELQQRPCKHPVTACVGDIDTKVHLRRLDAAI